MSRKLKKKLIRIVISIVLLIAAKVLTSLWSLPWWGELAVYLVPYLVIGWDILFRAARGIVHGQLLDENFLMSLATIGALILGDFAEATFVMLFYQIGEWFQDFAVGKSRKSISDLMDIAPDFVRVEEEGELVEKDPYELGPEDLFVCLPGDRIALDGTVEEGTASVDTSSLTGESVPRTVSAGDTVISGCICLDSRLVIRATAAYDDSTVAKVLELVENSSDKKSRTENFISRFARYYTPVIVGLALALALGGSLITGQWGIWVKRALIFLVVSCPCALVISIPLTFFGGIGGAAREGILIKGSTYLEALSKCKICALDKTGTLTKGDFSVKEARATGDPERLWTVAGECEAYSAHPIALAIQAENKKAGREIRPEGVALTVPGKGVLLQRSDRNLYAGSAELLEEAGIPVTLAPDEPGTVVYVADGHDYLGYILIADTLKDNARDAVASIKAAGISRVIMLTGDAPAIADHIGREAGVDEVKASLLPDEKVAAVETLRAEAPVIFAGDGINDAPVLAVSDVGIAMGAMGSAAAIEAADIVLMDDEPAKIAKSVRISQKTMRIVRENIVFSLAVKLVILALSALGITGMGLAVFGDVGVAFIAILNAMRALRKIQ